MVATKAALSIRVDALTDTDGKSEPTAPTIGMENRAKLESRLRALEYQGDLAGIRSFAGAPSSAKKQQKFEMNANAATYNTAADAVDLIATQRDEELAPAERAVKAVLDVKEEKKKAKEEKKRLKEAKEKAGKMDVDSSPTRSDKGEKDKEESAGAKAERKRLKKEAKKAEAANKTNGEANGEEKSEKKKRKRDDEEAAGESTKEKKKKKHKD